MIGAFAFRSKAVELKSVHLKDGDIIFQVTFTDSKLPQIPSKAKYNHLGIIYLKDGSYFVYEAKQPVQLTPFGEWIKKGENRHYVVKRLKNAAQVLTPEVILKLKNAVQRFNGKDYDPCFSWSDEKMYDSELVWKVYKDATGIEIGELQQLRDFEAADTLVQKQINIKCNDKPSAKELIISPSAIFNSELLESVIDN